MNISDLFPKLNEIVFAEKHPDEIERDLINHYESITNRTLARADPVRLFLESIAYVIILLRAKIDYAGKMNLLAYASGDFLDHLGALLEVERLQASPASVTLRFALSSSLNQSVLIPEGVRVTTDGDIFFATVESCVIAPGELTCEVKAQCTESGVIGNGFLPGQINKLVDPFPYEMNVRNIDTSAGGTNIESDENFRERIQIAPESFSVAGPAGAYKYYAMSANSDIIDVAVIGPAESDSVPPGNVYIYPLLIGGGLPNAEILDEVTEICASDSIRPDTDFVHVECPQSVPYSIHAEYFIDRVQAASAGQITTAVEDAEKAFITWQSSRLGRDINPSELIARLMKAGVKRVNVSAPDYRVLNAWEVAQCENCSVTFGGFEES